MGGNLWLGGAEDDGVQAAAPRGVRVLLYSHDTFGLGHLRRSSAIAKALVAQIPGVTALIATGSPVAGRFALPKGVDYVRLPGVVKNADGTYVAQNLGLDIDAITRLRAGVIEATVAAFEPDLMIVDKEPTGFRGELLPTLERLAARGGARLVLGLRDVLDAPEALAAEWTRKGALAAADRFYDEVWVYGSEAVYKPLRGLRTSAALRDRIHYTGYLRREAEAEVRDLAVAPPFILVTPGGGGDGAALIEWALAAYESDPELAPRAEIVFGPFLDADRRTQFEARARALNGRVRTHGFVGNMEALLARASGVVAMGGYNTFCEILSADKPAVLAPRTVPRREQEIRADAAAALGLMTRLSPGLKGDDPRLMAAAIRNLATQAPPSVAAPAGLLDGFDRIVERTRALALGVNSRGRAA